MRKGLLVLPCLAAFGCADNPQPAPDDPPAKDGTSDKWDDAPHGSPLLSAFIDGYSNSCDATSAQVEVVASYSDGSAIGQLACTLTFDDGETADGCLVNHVFASSGTHSVSAHVTDLATNAVVDVTETIYVYPLASYGADLQVSAPTCGLELSYKASLEIGAERHVTVEPADKIIAPAGYEQLLENTIQVTEPGTYTVRFALEDERERGPICTYEITKEVTVTACDGGGSGSDSGGSGSDGGGSGSGSDGGGTPPCN
jgi:hypothetical protein